MSIIKEYYQHKGCICQFLEEMKYSMNIIVLQCMIRTCWEYYHRVVPLIDVFETDGSEVLFAS